MSSPEADALQSVEDLIAAVAEARAALQQAEKAMRRGLAKARAGIDIGVALDITRPADMRDIINDALTKVEQCRHETRLKVFALALDQGMSIGALARAWGFSRQLAARYAKEARGEA